MTLTELYKAVAAALTDHPDSQRCKQLARNAQEIAALTGWAPGVIDPHGHFAGRGAELRERIKHLYQASGQETLAELHDALADLTEAVARHDADLTAARDGADGDDAIY